jgi:hypothetical protein
MFGARYGARVSLRSVVLCDGKPAAPRSTGSERVQWARVSVDVRRDVRPETSDRESRSALGKHETRVGCRGVGPRESKERDSGLAVMFVGKCCLGDVGRRRVQETGQDGRRVEARRCRALGSHDIRKRQPEDSTTLCERSRRAYQARERHNVATAIFSGG